MNAAFRTVLPPIASFAYREGGTSPEAGRMREGPRAQRFSRSVVPNDEREQYDALFDPATGLPQWALLVDRTEVARHVRCA